MVVVGFSIKTEIETRIFYSITRMLLSISIFQLRHQP